MNKEQLAEQLKGIEQEIDYRLDLRSKMRQQFADLVCPYIVGEKIQHEQTGERAIVAKITWLDYGDGYKLKINKIKKDGVPYKYMIKVYNPSEWSKL